MKKIAVISVASLSILALYYAWMREDDTRKSVAIVTTLSHPALDQVRKNFVLSLDHNVKIIEFNAEGNMQSANLIARTIAQNKNVVAVFTIGTLASLSVAKIEKNRPIVIAAMSDPEKILPHDLYKNICGLSDTIDAAQQIDTILKMLPQTKTISLLYSPHEQNSSISVENLAHYAHKKNLVVSLVSVHETQQIANASLTACQKSDVVLIPLDNQLVAAMPAVIKATRDKPCIIITSNESPIHQGATIAFGVDYQKMGHDAAVLMMQILKHRKTPEEIGYRNPTNHDLYINEHVIQEKSIDLIRPASAHAIDGK